MFLPVLFNIPFIPIKTDALGNIIKKAHKNVYVRNIHFVNINKDFRPLA